MHLNRMLGCRSAVARLSLGCRSAVARLSLGCRSAVARLSLGCRSTVAPLSLGFRSAVALLLLCCCSAVAFIPRMGWFHASGPIEIIYVRWQFITWWSKRGQVDLWYKLHTLYAFKQNTKSKFFVGITVKQRKFTINFKFIVANHIIADQFIQKIKSNPNKVHDLPSEMKRS